ncbi:carbohydrate kinase family protein [Daejeonella oryzae]|uniref:carbohydrate kinase family protein n=1 Tax=Daejeonella oryzae TaxID=1122943 RepID=UPI0006869C06|nr:PfkB family carbohydrate kinase [Daejeonella oryzae]
MMIAETNFSSSDSSYVLAIGESLIDAVSGEFINDLSEAKSLNLIAGGSPANFCRFLASNNIRSKLVAAVGKDGLGKILLEAMEKAGVSTTHIQQLEGHFTSVIIVARTKETPDFLPYRDADKYLQPIEDKLLEDSILVHTTAFALSHEPARTVILDAFHKAYALGKPVSVDWNYAEKIWGATNSSSEVFKILETFNPILKFSLDDAERFYNKSLGIEDAKNLLSSVNASVICLTCGAEGVWYKSAGKGWEHQPAKPVEVKDATGAGDAFWSGFISAYLNKLPVLNCVNKGIETAAKRLTGLI